MRLQANTDQVIAQTIGARIQSLRLKRNIGLEEVAKNAAISRQTLNLLLNHGKGTVANLISVLRAIDALERLSSLVEEVRPSPLQIIRMEGKKRLRASGRRLKADEKKLEPLKSKKDTDW